jgi:amino acid transporter
MPDVSPDSTHPLLDPSVRQRSMLAALLAWAGLGANGLSAACYGPEKAFLALGGHTQLGPLVALAMMATVALVALAYSQMFALFPAGGGSYRVTTQLLGPKFGLICGAALLVDYVLAVAVSLASGADALFSLLPSGGWGLKLPVELFLAAALVLLNARGLRVAIQVLFPVVLGFLLIHAILIVLGIAMKMPRLGAQAAETASATSSLIGANGWLFFTALLMRAYGLGGSTYSGVEAVSNNVNLLAEPRVRTGRMAMLYVAISLAFTAGGLVFLYSLWDVQPEAGRTLNATVLARVVSGLNLGDQASGALLTLTLGFEAAILFVAANSILIFAPSLLANMAADSWLPHQFRNLSVRLVRQNGVFFIGILALAVLWATHGNLATLIAFYSINVFLSLALAKAGLLRYWWGKRAAHERWLVRLVIAALALCVALVILAVTLTERLTEGSWATIGLTGLVLVGCLRVRAHYAWVSECRRQLDAQFALREEEIAAAVPREPFKDFPTIILLTTDHWGPAIHTLLWIQRLFPGHFRNVHFVSAIEFDARAAGAAETLPRRQARLDVALQQLEAFCAKYGLSARHTIGYGTDPVQELERLVRETMAKTPDSVCFANKLILPPRRRFAEWLHNQTALGLQRRLHSDGIPLMILPIRLGWEQARQ